MRHATPSIGVSDPWQQTACHETCHAALAHACGFPVVRVDLPARTTSILCPFTPTLLHVAWRRDCMATTRQMTYLIAVLYGPRWCLGSVTTEHGADDTAMVTAYRDAWQQLVACPPPGQEPPAWVIMARYARDMTARWYAGRGAQVALFMLATRLARYGVLDGDAWRQLAAEPVYAPLWTIRKG